MPLQLLPRAQAYIGPEHMLKVPERQEQRGGPGAEAAANDGSKDWTALIRHLKDEVANLQEFEVLLRIRNNDDRRFKLERYAVGTHSGEGSPRT